MRRQAKGTAPEGLSRSARSWRRRQHQRDPSSSVVRDRRERATGPSSTTLFWATNIYIYLFIFLRAKILSNKKEKKEDVHFRHVISHGSARSSGGQPHRSRPRGDGLLCCKPMGLVYYY